MQLKPTWQSLAIRALWLMFPMVVWGLMSAYGILPGQHRLMDIMLSVIIAGGIVQNCWIFDRQLGLYPDYLTFSTTFGGVQTFKWKGIRSASIEAIQRSILPSTCIFYFVDFDGGNHQYYLSDLSLAEMKQAIDFIKAKKPETRIITYYYNDDFDLEP